MKNNSLITSIIILAILITAILVFPYVGHIFQKRGQAPEAAHDYKRGPHQGRLLEADNFQVEVTMFEARGIPPKFRIYFYGDSAPIKPSEVDYQMQLTRLNKVENIHFKVKESYLESIDEVNEPHSFKVNLSAEYKDKPFNWEYESYEGRVELTQEAIKGNSIKIEKAESQILEMKVNVMGKIMPNEEFTIHITPRFPGVVKNVYKRLGDYVQKGEVLAVIESNESLQNYEIKSEVNGMVIKKDINIGMYLTGQENVFIISDLNTVWADFNVYRRILHQIKVGDPVEVKSLEGDIQGQSDISYISPLGHESTQSVIARAVLANTGELWKPGLFISGEITVDKVSVPVAIKDSALQTFRDWDVVFISVGNTFEVAPVQIGRKNKEWVEIISGLSPGDNYVSENSFVLKAELEKSGAKHEH